MEKIRTITVFAKEITVDKKKFVACMSNINEKWYKIKFTMECGKAPKKSGMYEISFTSDMCSVQHGKTFTTKDGKKGIDNDTIWLKNVKSIREYQDEDYSAITEKELDNIFGE